MTDSPTVVIDTRRMLEDLRALLYEPFRSAFLHRERRGKPPDTPGAAVESTARTLLFELPATRREVKKIVGRHARKNVRPRSRAHRVYVPEVVRKMAVSIGREAWEHRYNGPTEMVLKVRQSTISLHEMRHPDRTIRSE